MLNIILIFSMILNLGAGFLLMAVSRSVIRRGIYIPRRTAIPDADFWEWDSGQE